jgi:aspartyl-tRNA(Asn)/glutamyl-tRNA(Gln) amidotransferase subunit C
MHRDCTSAATMMGFRPPTTIRAMPVDIDIDKVARLARLDLAEDVLAQYREQLGDILEHAARVQALPTDDVAPTSHPLAMTNNFRPDEATGALDRDEVLAQAPEAEEGYFRVPRILDEPGSPQPR